VLRNRWTVLSVCLVFSLMIVTPVSTADNLVYNGDFNLGDSVSVPGWTREAGQYLLDSASGDPAPSLAVAGANPIRETQCIGDVTSLGVSARVGGSIRNTSGSVGNIGVEWYTEPDCGGDPALVDAIESEWNPNFVGYSETYDLSGGGYQSVKIILYTNEGGDATYNIWFDNIYVEGIPTAVHLSSIGARAGGGIFAALVLVAALSGLGRRRRG